MTPAIWIAFISSFPGAVAAVIAAIVSVRNGFKSDAIHVLVNSNLTAVKEQLAAALLEIANLKSLIHK